MASTLEMAKNEIETFLNITEDDTVRLNNKIKFTPKEISMTIKERTQKLALNYGDIWYVALGFNIGTEMDKSRPVIVVSTNNEFNKNSNLVSVVPVTSSKLLHESQFVVNDLNYVKNEEGFTRDGHVRGIAKVEQIRSVSKGRFFHKLGSLNEKGQAQLKEAIKNHLL